ncbi:Hypothetical protein POVR1_LOCUS222 [uncultured virus]|nr:Hypothetical protein POVR1_LOCUS222 [uncultured virus]
MDPPILTVHLSDGSTKVDRDILKRYPSSVLATWINSNPSSEDCHINQLTKDDFDQIYDVMLGNHTESSLDLPLYQKANALGLTSDIIYGYSCRLLEQQEKKLQRLEKFIRGEESSILIPYEDYGLMVELTKSYDEIIPVQFVTEQGGGKTSVQVVSIYRGLPISCQGHDVVFADEAISADVVKMVRSGQFAMEQLTDPPEIKSIGLTLLDFPHRITNDQILIDVNHLRYLAAFQNESVHEMLLGMHREEFHFNEIEEMDQLTPEADLQEIEKMKFGKECDGDHVHNLANLFSSNLEIFHRELWKALDATGHYIPVEKYIFFPYAKYQPLYKAHLQSIPLKVANILSHITAEVLVEDLFPLVHNQESHKTVALCATSRSGGYEDNVNMSKHKQYFGFVNLKSPKFNLLAVEKV